MAADTKDDFQKELVDLFGHEAQEWLQNIHVALDELQQGPAPERHTKLIEMISAGVTNLGGSAATINLPAVADVSFAAMPFIEALQDPHKSFSVQDFLSLCKQLGQIQTELACATGISFEDSRSRAEVKAVYANVLPRDFLRALQGLQEKQSPDSLSGRNLIRSMIDQIEGQVDAGVERIDATAIQGFLSRESEAEELFLKTIDERMPELCEKMGALKVEEDEISSRMESLEASLQDVASLRTEAQQVNAGSAMVFFTGLHSLLTVVAQRRIFLASARVEAITTRLTIMGHTIRQWVDSGQAERAAIGQLLSASQS